MVSTHRLEEETNMALTDYLADLRDFRVLEQNGLTRFSGGFGESVDVEKFSELVNKAKQTDFSELARVSWSGIRFLQQTWQSLWPEVKLSHVPIGIFEQFLLLDFTWTLQNVDSVELKYPNVGSNKTIPLTDLLNLEHELQLSDESQSQIADATRVLASVMNQMTGATADALPPGVSFPEVLPADPLGQKAVAYLSFLAATQAACGLSLHSLTQTLVTSMIPLTDRYLSYLKTLQTLGDQVDIMEAENADLILDSGVDELMRGADSLMNSSASLRQELLGALKLCRENKETGEEALINLLRSTESIQASMQMLAYTMESSGNSLIEGVMSIPSPSDMARKLKRILEIDGDRQKLEEICQHYAGCENTLNLSESDLTAKRLYEMLAEGNRVAESVVAACMVELQQLDGIRQILEHRISELKLLVERLQETPETPLGEFMSNHGPSLIERTIRWLVTDQERAIFKPFFPEEQTGREGSVDTDEVNFF